MLTLEKLTAVIGPRAPAVPLNAAVLDRVQKPGYAEIRVEYDVDSHERIRAYLLIPDHAESAPAVFCHHQHASNFALGKSEVVGHDGDPDQALACELAQRGFVVLAPDAIAFEERNWSLPTGRAEYFELVTRLVKGETLLAKVLSDVSVGIDYLASLDNVDADRIGFIGHSYGGRMAIWAAAVDQRLKASVSNCGCVNYKDSLDREIGIQAEFCVPDMLSVGDVEDVVRLIAPRALYLSATTQDKYSRGAQQIYDYAKDSFPDTQLQLQLWEGTHVFTEDMRVAAYEFLEAKL
ncbi:MAG: dienelactone hydrolase family protein [Pseudomonadota bacterium]